MFALVAQWTERDASIVRVVGSIPAEGTIIRNSEERGGVDTL